MAKRKTIVHILLPENSSEASNETDVLEEIQKPYEIKSASIKDEKCNYGYEIKTGKTAGDKIPTRKAQAIIHPDMSKAFDALRVHFAVACDAFKHLFKKLPDDLEKLRIHDVVNEVHVTGFSVNGNDEDEGYVVEGYKYVSLGVIPFDSPKLTKGNYKYYDDLKEKMDVARAEVEEYMNGKHSDDDDDNQPELPFGAGKTSADEFDEFE